MDKKLTRNLNESLVRIDEEDVNMINNSGMSGLQL